MEQSLKPLTTPLAAWQPEQLAASLLREGALLLRTGAALADFLALGQRCAEAWGPFIAQDDQTRSVGGNSGRVQVAGLNSLFTSTGRDQPHLVPLHGELYFQQTRPPQLLWFYCASPATAGGATLICDGQTLYAALPAALRQSLSQQRLEYSRWLDRPIWERLYGLQDPAALTTWLQAQSHHCDWQPDGSLRTRFEAPAIVSRTGGPVFINNLLPFGLRQIHSPEATRARVCFAGGEAIPEALILTIERLAAAQTQAVAWQRGDVLLLDNTRMLHGREAVSDPQREIYVRMSEAGFLAELLPA